MKKTVLLLAGLFLWLPVVWAEPQDAAPVTDLNQKVALLQSKIERISASQDQVVQKNNEISKELADLRIWIRRNRG